MIKKETEGAANVHEDFNHFDQQNYPNPTKIKKIP